MSNIDVLKQEIQSWYPDYEFTDEELNSAVRNLIKYEAKNKGLQSAEFPVKLNK